MRYGKKLEIILEYLSTGVSKIRKLLSLTRASFWIKCKL